MKKLLPFLLFFFLFTKSFAQKWDYDTTFGINNFIKLDSVKIISLQLQSDGKIVALGYKHFGSDYDTWLWLYRFTKNGLPDTSFKRNGALEVGKFRNGCMAVQPDNKIIISGGDYNSTFHKWALISRRFNENGSIDTGFSPIDSSLQEGLPSDIRIQKDGKILMALLLRGAVGVNNLTLSRFNQNGKIDTGFGNRGIDTLYFSPTFIPFGWYFGSLETRLEIQSDDKILIKGWCITDHMTDDPYAVGLAFGRFNKDGSIDRTFGIKGKNTFGFGPNHNKYSGALIKNGDLMIAYANWGFVKFSSTGDLDSSLYKPKSAYDMKHITIPKTIYHEYYNFGMVADLTGGILYGSYILDSNRNDFNIMRMDTSGNLDTAFNHTGYLSFKFYNSGSPAMRGDIVISQQPDGKIIFVGIKDSYPTQTTIARFMPYGRVISSAENTSNSSPTFALFPNPAKESATLEYHLSIPADMTLDLFDIQGRRLKTETHKHNAPNGKEEISLRDFPQGVYILSVSCGTERKMVKLIKQ